ncbi:MAG: ExbD/TolR family protein [Elusimicrobiota bacterium]
MFDRFRQKSESRGLFGVMAPMADVVFLLLIFFMLTSAFVLEPGVDIQLPRAATAEDIDRHEQVLTVTRERTLLLNEEVVTFDELEEKLVKTFAREEYSLLIIRADENVPHGMVVRALDTARQSGISELAIATEPLR